MLRAMGAVPSLCWFDALNVMAEPNGSGAVVGLAAVPRARCTMPPRVGVGLDKAKM